MPIFGGTPLDEIVHVYIYGRQVYWVVETKHQLFVLGFESNTEK